MIRSISRNRIIEIVILQRGFQKGFIMSGPVETSIRMKIATKLSPEHLDVINESFMHNVPKGSESHFKVVVVSSQFENKPLIQRHRMVNDALSEEFNKGLHALSIVAKTPSQWTDSDKKLFHSEAIIDLTNEDIGDLGASQIDVNTPKSPFIVKRIERLLDKGGYTKDFYTSSNKSLSQGSVSYQDTNPKELHILESVPVVKLVKQDFIAQLPVASDTKRSLIDKMSGEPKKNNSKKVTGIEELADLPNKQYGDVPDASLTKKSVIPHLKDEKPVAKKGKEINEERNKSKVKDGNYFLKILDERIKVLENIASDCEGNVDLCHVEESKGELRSVAGKARLLVTEKFKQFRGLCHKNLVRPESDTFPTTDEDLLGFWDMISLQYDEILLKYETAKMMKENDWKMPQKKVNKAKPAVRTQLMKTVPLRTIQPIKPPQPIKTKPNNDPSNTMKDREAERKRLLMERRLAMKKVTTDPTIKTN